MEVPCYLVAGVSGSSAPPLREVEPLGSCWGPPVTLAFTHLLLLPYPGFDGRQAIQFYSISIIPVPMPKETSSAWDKLWSHLLSVK